jgi:hypothetical protein
MAWYDLLNIGFLIIIWGFIFAKNKVLFSRRKFWVFFFATYTITELISIPLSLKGVNNLWLYNISKPIQFLFLLNYFSNIFHFKKIKTYILSFGLAICLVFLFSKKIDSYSSLEEVLYGAIITIFCVYYFNSIIRAKDSIDLTLSEFWYCSSLFIFFGTSLCINGSLDFLINNDLQFAQKLFYGLVINSYIFYLLTIYALFLNFKLPKSR